MNLNLFQHDDGDDDGAAAESFHFFKIKYVNYKILFRIRKFYIIRKKRHTFIESQNPTFMFYQRNKMKIHAHWKVILINFLNVLTQLGISLSMVSFDLVTRDQLLLMNYLLYTFLNIVNSQIMVVTLKKSPYFISYR